MLEWLGIVLEWCWSGVGVAWRVFVTSIISRDHLSFSPFYFSWLRPITVNSCFSPKEVFLLQSHVVG